jgi:hypothetical protein
MTAGQRLAPVIALLLALVTSVYSVTGLAASISCGIKPIPRVGCKVGSCVDGRWQQQCDSRSGLACGLKPLPRPGCEVARCIDGKWQQDCSSQGDHVCGLKPLPKPGCRVGNCVDGKWQQTCD